ncbi:MAG: M28 family peptidase [Phaeodactylibacter sp.]|nr:M28 family peptidase [Phaeodactylibacter sp.]
MKNYLPLFVAAFLLTAYTLSAQSAAQLRTATDEGADKATIYATSILPDDLSRYLHVLASDEYEGRETGTPGMEKAAEYIAAHFEKLGLPKIGADNSYFQPIIYTAVNWETVKLSAGDTKFRHLWDYYSFPGANTDREETVVEDNLVFLGYGIDDERYSDYQGANVKGKAILIYGGEPVNEAGISQVTGTEALSDWADDWRKKVMTAHEHGVSTVFIIDTDIKKSVNEQRRFMLSPRFQIGKGEEPEGRYANSFFISTTVAKEMMGNRYQKAINARDKMKAEGKSKAVKLKTEVELTQDKRIRQLLGANVLGFIEGSDPLLKDEVVVVTAHYDHLGKRGEDIYNGADDNGSGTSAVMELAEAFAKAKAQGAGPRRSVLCMLVSGEEKGLLGSRYYVENPRFPLENTVANVNIDMIGRVDEEHAADPNYIYVIGSNRLSTELHQINEEANRQYTQLALDYTYNAENDPNRYYYRSDHYNFAEHGIPAIFYFSGTHEDYHQITDTVDKINFEKAAKIARLAFYVAWELANRDKRIEVDVE